VRIIAFKNKGDTQQPAHGGDREGGPILAHEPEPFDGIVFVSRANQAAAFERMDRVFARNGTAMRFPCNTCNS
jgi:hypothetical protein